MYKTIIIIAVFLALFTPNVFAHLTDDDDIVKVIITDEGFEPDFVSVHAGTMIVWSNEGERPHWPATDVHPSHKLYPGSNINDCLKKENMLDACGGLEKGETFSFVFDKAGKWSMHDHLFPGRQMTVEIFSDEKIAEQKEDGIIAKILSFLGEKFKSIGSFLTGFSVKKEIKPLSSPEDFLSLSYPDQKSKIYETAKQDPKKAWEFLKTTFAKDRQIEENPHQLAHIIGNEIYTQKGFEGISVCDPTFAFGCYHGVTEKMLLDKGTGGIKDAEKSCLSMFPGQNELVASCIHGTGHGLLSWESLDVSKALNDCDILSDYHRPYCYDGVFMEHSFGAKTETSWDFCSSFDEKYHQACGRYQIYLFGESFNWDFSRLASMCDQAPNNILKDNCFSGLGFLATSISKGDFNQIKRLCSLASAEGRNKCTINAAIETIFQEYRDWWVTSASLCDSIEQKDECIKRTQQIITGYNRVPNSNQPDEIKKIKAAQNLDEQEKYYLQLIKRVGPEEAQEHLYRSGLPFTGQTHLLNHLSGDYLYATYGAAGLLKCRDYYLASCYHGFILNAIAIDGLDSIEDIWAECKKFGTSVTSQCAHALGHGFLAWVDYPNLLEAIDMCNDLEKKVDGFHVYNCRDGVFMENIWGVHDGKPAEERWINEADIFYPCNDPRISSDDLDGCWSNQPSLMYQMTGNLTKAGEACLQVENSTHQRICFNGLSRQIHPLTKGNDDATFNLCSTLPKEWYNYCIQTIAVSDFSVGGRDMSFRLCSRIENSAKDQCYRGLFGSMGVYARSQEEYSGWCSLVLDEEWKKACNG